MYCDKSIHFYLNQENYIECPFCDEKIQNFNPIKYTCCDNMNIINDDLLSIYKGHICLICENCASIHGYQPSKEYIDFYANRYRMRRKSVYNRKYHLENKIINLVRLHNTQISYSDQKKIFDIFEKIGRILPIINNGTRKRMIKIDFILNELFCLLNINIKIPRKESKKAFLYNKKYWDRINSLIGKEIQSILVR